jgi:anti-sigma-K factor RskA
MFESTDHVSDLLPEFSLGTLGDEETLWVIEHLQDCKACQAELELYQPVMAGLGFAAPAVEPPADLRSKILTKASADVERKKEPSRQRKPLLAWMLSWRWLGALAVILLVGSNLLLWQQYTHLQTQTGAGSFQTVALKGTNNSPNSSGTIVISHDGMYGTLVVDDLSPLDPAHQYQLWLIRDGQRVSGAVFSVSQTGYGTTEIISPDALTRYTAFGITIEPAGGSPGPTGDKVLGSIQ